MSKYHSSKLTSDKTRGEAMVSPRYKTEEKMKAERIDQIRVLIDADTKKKFQTKCLKEDVDMSTRIRDLIRQDIKGGGKNEKQKDGQQG